MIPIAPDVLEPYAAELHQLSDLLGDGNDLVVLAHYVEAVRGIADARRNELLSDLIQRRETLWKEARRLGGRLLGEETERFASRVERCWVEARPQLRP